MGRIGGLLAGLLVVVLVVPANPIPLLASEPAGDSSGAEIVAGEILVLFKPSVSDLNAEDALRRHGLEPADDAGIGPGGLVRVKVEEGREEAVAAELAGAGDVLMAGPNHILTAAVVPDDPYCSSQWSLPKIQAPLAWDYSTGSSDITIAIVDSGLDTSLAEFGGRIVHPYDAIHDDTVPQDTCGHGTHVAGIAAAEGNNLMGIAGMAWRSMVMPVRVLTYKDSRCSGYESDIYTGIYWAVEHGADIINLSLGGPSWPESATCEDSFPVMSSAVQYAHDSGVLVVAAAGNDGNPRNRLYCPAYQSAAMAVGATGPTDTRATFSNYGPGLDVVAPGSNIVSTLPEGNFAWWSGTSMASPHVSGLAALVWSLNRALERDAVRAIIEETAEDLGTSGWDEQYGHGRINAFKALAGVGLALNPSGVAVLFEDSAGMGRAHRQLSIQTTVSPVLTWTVTTSPSVDWIESIAPASGTVAAGSPATLAITVTTPLTYGVYTTSLVLQAVNGNGTLLQTPPGRVLVSYVPELDHVVLMPVFKGFSSSE